jgi:hypothetical protein
MSKNTSKLNATIIQNALVVLLVSNHNIVLFHTNTHRKLILDIQNYLNLIRLKKYKKILLFLTTTNLEIRSRIKKPPKNTVHSTQQMGT